MSRHQCPVRMPPETCRLIVPDSKLMCLGHWRRVPKLLRDAVLAAYAGGAGVGTPELADAQQAAIDAVEAKLAAAAESGA